MKNPQQSAIITPFAKSAVDCFPGAIPLWKVFLSSTTSRKPKHSIQNQTVIFCRPPHLGMLDHILHSFPLFICQLIASVCHSYHPESFYHICPDSSFFTFQIRPSKESCYGLVLKSLLDLSYLQFNDTAEYHKLHNTIITL